MDDIRAWRTAGDAAGSQRMPTSRDGYTRNVSGRLAPGIGRLFFIDGPPLHLGNSFVPCRPVMVQKFPRPTGFRLAGGGRLVSISGAAVPSSSDRGQPPPRRRKSTMASVVLEHGSDRDFSRYLREVGTFPMLPAETVFQLGGRPHDRRDGKPTHGLVMSRLRLVATIAAGCCGHAQRFGGLIVDRNGDPIQVHRGGDPDRGFRLASRAMHWIRAAAGHGLTMPRGVPASRKRGSAGTAGPVSCPMDARGS
jgi:hypothetical protein